MLDVVNERLIGAGRSADRVRPRLPRRDLRLVRHDDQRRGARADRGHGHLPAPHAELPGRRHDLHRAVAGAGVSRDQGPGRRPRARSTGSSPPAASSRPRPAARRTRNAIPIPKQDVGHRDGRRGVHRLRRLRGGVSQRLGVAVHRRQDHPPRAAAAGTAGALPPRVAHGARRWTSRASARCTLYGECQEACPKEISIDTIARMNRDFLRASLTAGRAAVAESD